MEGKLNKTFGEIVREYFPDASDEEAKCILWSRTGYPCFWTQDDVEAELREQLQAFKDSLNPPPEDIPEGKFEGELEGGVDEIED